jgi:hypothetical protein
MKRPDATRLARTARRGITIIEVLIVATGVAMLLGLCAVSIQILMRLNSDGMARYAAASSFERLGRQLRHDVHASKNASVPTNLQAADKRLTLRLALEAGHGIAYAIDDGGVVRTESQGDKVVHHEAFALARGVDARFEIRNEGSRPMITLIVERQTKKGIPGPSRPLEVMALQGKDRDESSEKAGAKSP